MSHLFLADVIEAVSVPDTGAMIPNLMVSQVPRKLVRRIHKLGCGCFHVTLRRAQNPPSILQQPIRPKRNAKEVEHDIAGMWINWPICLTRTYYCQPVSVGVCNCQIGMGNWNRCVQPRPTRPMWSCRKAKTMFNTTLLAPTLDSRYRQRIFLLTPSTGWLWCPFCQLFCG
jgi:hypothetical protein